MMIRKPGRGALCLLLAICCLLFSGAAARAAGGVDMTAVYEYDGQSIDGVTVRLYYAAALDRDTYLFTPAEAFASVCTPEALERVSTAAGNRALAERLADCADEKGILPTASGTTASGRVRFSGLEEGLYLLRSDCPAGYQAEQALICLPQWEAAGGRWLDTVTVTAKLLPQTVEGGDAPPEDSEGPEDIPEGDVPLTQPRENDTPPGGSLSGRHGTGWALVNLICTILTGLIAIGMLCAFFQKQDKEDRGEDQKEKRNKGRLLGLLPAAGAVIAFLLTEDMRLPMGLVDRWTPLMVILLLVNGFLAYRTRRKKEERESAAV